jgi:F-type H+-transporting ATPase subunit delta
VAALTGSAARRYAEALIELAGGDIDRFRVSLENLAVALGPRVLRLLREPRVPLADRRKLLEDATRDEPPAIRSVVQLLLERDRIQLLPRIATAYAELVEQREGIVRARVTTAVAIDDPRRADVVRRLEHSSGKKVRATFAVDPSLIGGTRVQLGDRLVDTSLATQLQELKRSLAGAP